MTDRSALRVVLAAGGTGGHVYPAIAIADALRAERPDCRALFVGTRDRMEWQAVPKAGYPIRAVWISGFHRRLTLQNLLFPLKVLVSLLQSLLILRGFRPDLVVGCGGFASGPVGWVAARLGIPLFLHEQNCFPGVTTRLLAPLARRIYLTFPDEDGHFDADRVQVVGNPTRESLLPGAAASSESWLLSLGLDPKRPVLLVLGGSGGAGSLNEAVLANLDALMACGGGRLQLIWQCGATHEAVLRARLRERGLVDGTKVGHGPVRLMGFIDRMPEAYASATLVACRAGAGTLSEVLLAGKPALAIPSPNVAGDHQMRNARHLEAQGALQVLPEKDAADQLAARVGKLLESPDKLVEMAAKAASLARPDAARALARDLLRRTGREAGQADTQKEEESDR